MEPILSTSGEVEWSADNQHVFYVTKDHQERYALPSAPLPLVAGGLLTPTSNPLPPCIDHVCRPFKVWRHVVGEKEDVQVFEESDEAFYVGIGKSRSEKIIFIECGEAQAGVMICSVHIAALRPAPDDTALRLLQAPLSHPRHVTSTPISPWRTSLWCCRGSMWVLS